MRERHLQTDEYPYAYFVIDKISGLPNELPVDTGMQGTVNGFFYLHGVKRVLSADVSVTRKNHSDGSVSLQVTVQFPIHLDDYAVPRPRALFMKLAETVAVKVRFTASSVFDAEEFTPPDWPESK
jgi:hypothetical protein